MKISPKSNHILLTIFIFIFEDTSYRIVLYYIINYHNNVSRIPFECQINKRYCNKYYVNKYTPGKIVDRLYITLFPINGTYQTLAYSEDFRASKRQFSISVTLKNNISFLTSMQYWLRKDYKDLLTIWLAFCHNTNETFQE